MLRKVLIFTCFLSVQLEKSPLVDILKSKHNKFNKVNEIVHKTLNKLFISIKLNRNFTESTNVKMLLTMHHDLNNIAEENCKIYTDLMNIVTFNNKTSLDLNDVLDQIIRELQNNHSDKYQENITNKFHELEMVSVKRNSEESLDFLSEFLAKINKLTVNDFINQSLNNENFNNTTDLFHFRRNNKEHNLKVWHPSSSKEMEPNNEQYRRIYKGKRTTIRKHPFIVSIHLEKQFLCGGSIISKDLVVTAASCLQRVYNNKKLREDPSSKMHARFASDYIDKSGETVPVSEIHFHPAYNWSNLRNNLAVIKLAPQKRFSVRPQKIRRIVYDKNAKRLRGVRKINILGWSATDHVLDSNPSKPLARAKVAVYNFKKCQNIYTRHYVNKENFCVGLNSRGYGACNADVGGPGIINKVLVGIISFGSPVCGDHGAPTVLTKLGYYAKWIESLIDSNPKNKENIKLTSDEKQGKTRTVKKQKHSDAVNLLKKMLDEFVTNDSFMDEFLHGDIENDLKEIFNFSTTNDPLQHPLEDKIVYLNTPHIHNSGKYDETKSKILDEEITRRLATETPAKYFNPKFTQSSDEDESYNVFGSSSKSIAEESETSDVGSDDYESDSYEDLSIYSDSRESPESENIIDTKYKGITEHATKYNQFINKGPKPTNVLHKLKRENTKKIDLAGHFSQLKKNSISVENTNVIEAVKLNNKTLLLVKISTSNDDSNRP